MEKVFKDKLNKLAESLEHSSSSNPPLIEASSSGWSITTRHSSTQLLADLNYSVDNEIVLRLLFDLQWIDTGSEVESMYTALTPIALGRVKAFKLIFNNEVVYENSLEDALIEFKKMIDRAGVPEPLSELEKYWRFLDMKFNNFVSKSIKKYENDLVYKSNIVNTTKLALKKMMS